MAAVCLAIRFVALHGENASVANGVTVPDSAKKAKPGLECSFLAEAKG
jgi:hypothetical protein